MRILWLAIACVVPAVAAADPPSHPADARNTPEPPPPRSHLKDPRADIHFQAGLDAYDLKKWDLASMELDAANSLEPTPFLLYARAQAERFNGHCAKAVELYQKFLYTDANITPQWRAATQGFIRECEASMPIPAPEVTPAPPKPWYKDPLGDGLAISGVLGLFIGIGYLSAASASHDRADHAIYLDDHNQARADFSSQSAIGGTALGLGLALLGGGIYVYTTRHRGNQTESIVTTDGRSVIYAAKF